MRPKNYFSFYKDLLVKTNHMSNDDFEQMVIHESNQISNFFYTTSQGKQLDRLILNFRYLQPKLEQNHAIVSIKQLDDRKYGKMINVVYKKNSEMQSQYEKWIHDNYANDLMEQLKFSTLIPFLFLDVEPNDSLFCQGTINPNVIKIFSKILSNGTVFVNEPDVKKGKNCYNFGSDNLCILYYDDLSEIPQIQQFDKAVCIAPSSEDGFVNGIQPVWSVDVAIKNHEIQKKYLRSCLKKLKKDGICVYSTFSINPIENESVVNEVLSELKEDFVLVDCSNKYNEIERYQGLTDWKINNFDSKTQNVDNINFCMRFYSHLIHSDSTFVAVIRRKRSGSRIKFQKENDDSDENQNDLNEQKQFSQISQDILNNIIDEFGFDINDFNDISFYHSTMFDNIIFYVSEKLKLIIEKEENKSLKICCLGSSSFFFKKNDLKSIPIPSYANLPRAAKNPSKRVICLSFKYFQNVIKSLTTSIEEFPNQIKEYLKSIKPGGLFIKVYSCDYMLGASLDDGFIKLKMSSEKAKNIIDKVNDLISCHDIEIGNSDFYSIRRNNLFYVDKTDFISLWWKDQSLTTLITRPRGFGKSLMMSMVKCFFSTEYADAKKELFKGTNIWSDKQMMKIQGTYPVISLNFGKDKYQNVDSIINLIKYEIVDAFQFFMDVLISSDQIEDHEKEFIKSINYNMNNTIAFMAINFLSIFVEKAYDKKVIILLDEFDSPILKFGFNHDDSITDRENGFLESFFISTFRENPSLERAIITGITQIRSNSIISGFSKMQIIKSTSKKFSTIFGFTYSEVLTSLTDYHLDYWRDDIFKWYDGYYFGDSKGIGNPLSITKFMNELKGLSCYWLDSNDNSVIYNIIQNISKEISISLINLIQNHEIVISLQEDITYKDIFMKSQESILGFLVSVGYLTIDEQTQKNGITLSKLKIPNFEVQKLFEGIIESWFASSVELYSEFIQNFIDGNNKSLSKHLNQILMDNISSFDSMASFIHCLCLKMFIDLKNDFYAIFNHQNEKSLPNIVFRPKDKVKNSGYIIIFKYEEKHKNCRRKHKNMLNNLLQKAQKQINDFNYDHELTKKGIDKRNIIKYVMVFYDFECFITINGIGTEEEVLEDL